MPKVKISEYSATANSNTDVASINIDEGCAPSGINNAIRAVMGHLKDFQQGTNGDPFNGPVNGTLGATTASTANVTTLTTSSTVTHNGGTANGVAYLNGSKVLTTGSALTFDGTSLAVGGVATVQGELNVFKTGSAPTLYVQGDGGNSTTQGIIRIGGALGRAASIQGFREGSSNLQALRFYSYNSADQLNYEITGAGTSIWSVGGSEQMRLTSTGLGIGTSSPAYKLDAQTTATGTAAGDNTVAFFGSQASGRDANIRFGDSVNASARIGYLSGSLYFYTNANERARIDLSGNLLVGGTTVTNSAKSEVFYNGSTHNGFVVNDTASATSTGFVLFTLNGATAIGSIARVSATSAVVYNTTSDYRLKTVTGAVTGQGARIDALKPVDYMWTEGGQQARGFLAHEFQAVYSNSVTGDKDAVDANGSPKYQAMQAATSEVIADLVAEIQSLRKRLAALESA